MIDGKQDNYRKMLFISKLYIFKSYKKHKTTTNIVKFGY